MWDIVITVGLALLNLAVAGLGLYYTGKHGTPWWRWFIAVVILTCIITGLQTHLAKLGQEKSEQKIIKTVKDNPPRVDLHVTSPPAQVFFTAPTPPPAQNGFLQLEHPQEYDSALLFTLDKPLMLNVGYTNKGTAPVRDGYTASGLSLTMIGDSQAKRDLYAFGQFCAYGRGELSTGAAGSGFAWVRYTD